MGSEMCIRDRNGKTGLSVESGDASSLANATIRLARDPELASELVAGGKSFVAENFRPEPLVDQVELVYQRITQQRQAA